jgi:hypothetical protein
MDKSPLKTLTLEDFLESERHKLTGTLTPVTPATFAEWKKKRLDKKAAEEEAQKAKDATGRMLFESGEWRRDSDDEDEDDSDEDDQDVWNLESMRRETERLRQQKEDERMANLNGGSAYVTPPETETTAENQDTSQAVGEEVGVDGAG